MTTYYVRKTGNDGNAGTSAGAAWLTIGKALGASGMASGDTVYVGAGTYREVVTIGFTPSVETKIIGDVTGQYTGDAGLVIWTAFTTNDKTAPSANSTLNLAGKSYLTFENLYIVGGADTAGSCVDATTTTNSHDIVFRRCILVSQRADPCIDFTCGSAATLPTAWTLDKCVFNGQVYISISTRTSGGHFDIGWDIKNCVFLGAYVSIVLDGLGTSTYKGSGVDVFNCLFLGSSDGVKTLDDYICSTTYKVYVYNCIFVKGDAESYCLRANTSGQITENYNYIGSNAPRTNVTAGGSSATGGARALRLFMGQEWLAGLRPMPLGMPTPGSPFLGWGNQGGGPSDDFLGVARPCGGSTSNAIGGFEGHQTAAKETSTVRSGSNALCITGPGIQDFYLSVDAASTTISVYGRFDSNYSGTKPQLKVLHGEHCGVADATDTMEGSANTWEQLSLNFTPTAKGVITVRLVSNSSAASGKAFFDDFSKV